MRAIVILLLLLGVIGGSAATMSTALPVSKGGDGSAASTAASLNLELMGNVIPAPLQTRMTRWAPSEGGNGHYYETVVVPGGINWAEADALATSRGGYLATITSAEENDVVFELFHGVPGVWYQHDTYLGPWFGGMQEVGSAEPLEGWFWMTGEPFEFQNWGPTEPNNANGNENRLHYLRSNTVSNEWNDLRGARSVGALIVEYERDLEPFPILEYLFDETGVTAPSTGLDSTPARLLNHGWSPTDLHSGNAMGATGLPGDRAFDNSGSTGMGGEGVGNQAVVADNDAADDLLSLTLQGWMRAENMPIGNLARLFAKQSGGTGFLLLGSNGRLILEINNVGVASPSETYADVGEWIFFAVAYDGTQDAGNVRFYKGSRHSPVTLVNVQSLNQGRAMGNGSEITLGEAGGSLDRPFDGWLDSLRIFGSKTDDAGALDLPQLEWYRTRDIQRLPPPEVPPLTITRRGNAVVVSWPEVPGFQLESARRLHFPSRWIRLSGTPQKTNGLNFFIFSTGVTAERYFRLAKP